jgi:hypothetical protein
LYKILVEKNIYNENKWPFTPNLKSEYGPSIGKDLNEIACEDVNRQQIEGLIAVGKGGGGDQRRPFRQRSFLFLTVSC